MKISEKGLQFLMQEEGYRLQAYPDPAWGWKVPTIGVGHTGPEVHEGLVWTHAQVMEALDRDVDTWEALINRRVKVRLTQDQFDALASFTHNIGAGAFERSTLLAKLNAGDYAGASAEFPKWNIPDILKDRRRRERALFDGFVGRTADYFGAQITTADIQRKLGVLADGVYGPRTLAAVRLFQTHHGLVSDGIVGPRTLKAMGF